MKVGIGLGRDRDSAAAARDAARQAKKTVPKPRLAVAYASIHHDQAAVLAALREELDVRVLLGGSSYAEITNAGTTRGSVAVLLLDFEGGDVRVAGTGDETEPYALGRALADAAGPAAAGADRLFALLSVGLFTNREDEVARALAERLGRVPVFGGRTCGDYDLGFSHPEFWTNYQYGERLGRTSGRMALVRLPRDGHEVAFAYEHGWQAVGPVVELTRCEGGKVFEVDGRPIIEFYKQFLGREQSDDFFENMVQRYGFAVAVDGEAAPLVKVPIAWDPKAGCIEYSPSADLQGRKVQLIQASRKGLVDGARRAAERCREALGGVPPAFVFVVSCCTRATILHSKADLELDAVREAFGRDVPVFGYYAGGEYAPDRSRYDDAVDPARPDARSFYHATTISLMAVGARAPVSAGVPAAAVPAASADDAAEAARLRGLLAKCEEILDDNESFLSNLSRKSYRDGEQLRRQNGVIFRYTPHDVWKDVGALVARGEYELSDAEFVGTFLFMDVKGFTSYSEEHGSAEVVRVLNEIFAPATEIIYDCGGDVDKFIGDCIFAAFRDGVGALKAARRILDLLARLKALGNPFSVRIGLNSGRAVRANVGAKDRREYTYIGDAVNLAQRFESNCAPGRVLVCEALASEAAALFSAVERREIAVKGKKLPVSAFECAP